MKITVLEAMRLKKELAQTVDKLNYSLRSSVLGETKEDGELISVQGKESFLEVEEKLITSLQYSREINDKLSAFNRASGIDTLVRGLQNQKLLMNVYVNALPQTKATTTTRFENLGNGTRKAIKVEYMPNISSTQMKDRISAKKLIIRELQISIEKLNNQEIEVAFEYANIEALIN